jgi:hypothetical protein
MPDTNRNPDEPLLVTEQEAARMLSVSQRTMYTLRTTGQIEAAQMSERCVRYDVEDLRAFIAARKTGAAQVASRAAPAQNGRLHPTP